MLTSKLYEDLICGLDVEAASAEFWRRSSSSQPQVHEAAGVTCPDEPIRVPSSEPCHGTSLYPESHIVKLFFVMAESLDESTRNDYGAGLLHFNRFCDRLSIPEHDHAAGSIFSSTADNWLAGLRFGHIINGVQWHGERSECLRHVQRGLHHLPPPDLNPEHRPPITLESLIQLHQGLDHSNTFDTAVLVTTCLAFCLEELVIPAFASSDMTKHVTRFVLPIVTQESNDVRHSTFHIPWTKTTGTNGADINVTS
ncbi:hypothetical protein EDB19DRAFT_1907404 [Suillus lakei]|nr:hypothetical protein EDB19DRAFT_1907404 [Suillus lakei]